MSQSALTTQNAPRDPEELSKVGRFNLRYLAEQIGIFTDEASKGRFMNGSNKEMAQAIAMHLQAIDQGNGAAMVVQAPMAVPTVAQPVQRSPSNDAARTPVAQEPVRTAAAVPGPTEMLLIQLGKILDKVTEVDNRIDEYVNAVQELSDKVEDLTGVLKGNSRLASLQTSLTLMLAEQVLQAPRKDVLGAAFNDRETTATLVADLKKLDEDEEEGK